MLPLASVALMRPEEMWSNRMYISLGSQNMQKLRPVQGHVPYYQGKNLFELAG